MRINDLTKEIAKVNEANGWYDGDTNSTHSHMSRLMLVVTELAEAAEELREYGLTETRIEHGKPEGFPTELADALIRILDLVHVAGIKDFEGIIRNKMAYNATRGYRHGRKKV